MASVRSRAVISVSAAPGLARSRFHSVALYSSSSMNGRTRVTSSWSSGIGWRM